MEVNRTELSPSVRVPWLDLELDYMCISHLNAFVSMAGKIIVSFGKIFWCNQTALTSTTPALSHNLLS
jgi:hypothetical protein